ncbi:MAG: CPBP family glutamic-type intramembrane protease [Synechococcales bacterium]|nr:CPBP family glutamic-type intramembrane protease [Synechococcales bacterium]
MMDVARRIFLHFPHPLPSLPHPMITSRRQVFVQSQRLGWPRFCLVVVVSAIATLLIASLPVHSARVSSYDLAQQADFNRPDYYPIQQSAPNENYRPVGQWLGRLILPEPDAADSPENPDWVWFEVYHAPADQAALIGQQVRLEWRDQSPFAQAYVDVVTTDVALTEEAKQYAALGNVIPTRLDGRAQVGPLRSLAGARPHDDVTVKLDAVTLATDAAGAPVLQIDWEPVQVTGRFYGLVKILGVDGNWPADNPPAVCPGTASCPEYFRVRHYNVASGEFDGAEETVRIPQQPADNSQRFLSTPDQIENSPAGDRGWYIYGAADGEGIFTVQAIKPRSLVQLQPDQVIIGKGAGLGYLRRENWGEMGDRKGTVQSVWVSPTPDSVKPQEWQEGDQALVMHLFGGIGGESGEAIAGWTVTGHFAFGLATVVREPLADERQFDIVYQQIYAHNPNGIVAGSLDWTAYMGDLQRGWLGIRPVSDVLMRLDSLTPLQLGNTSLSPLREVLMQTQIMAARYRTGDGKGVSAVTPATSCVQDSSQALYIAIERLQQRMNSTPEFLNWLAAHPDDSATQSFRTLVSLGNDLSQALVPRGVVRPDWRQNAEYLAGIEGQGALSNEFTLENVLLSWRTMMPRSAYDEISSIFLNHNAQLWFLSTNQVGGWDASIEPVAPTPLLGQLPLVSTVIKRLVNAVLTPLDGRDWLVFLGVLVGYGAIALPIGFKSGLLRLTPTPTSRSLVKGMVYLFFLPSLMEEVIFRVLLLPHPTTVLLPITWLGWATLSLVLFILCHPLNALTLYPAGRPTFFQWPFLLLAGLLGVACTLLYGWTGSLWTVTLLHWLVVVLWLFYLGGQARLYPAAAFPPSRLKLP